MEEVRLSILDHLDKLEEVFLEGNRIPFSGNRLVNEQDAIELLDEIRESLPEEIIKATDLLKQADKYMDRSKQLSEQLLAKAKYERNQLVGNYGVRQEAERQINEIQSQSKQKCEYLINEAKQKASLIEKDMQTKIIQLENIYSMKKQKLEADSLSQRRKIELDNIELNKDLKKRFDNNNAKAIEQIEKCRQEVILIQRESQKEAERIKNQSIILQQQTQKKCDSLLQNSQNEAANIQEGANRYADQTLRELERRIMEMNQMIIAGRAELDKIRSTNTKRSKSISHQKTTPKSIPFVKPKNQIS